MTATLEQMIADWLEPVEPASTLQRVWKLRGQPNDWTLENVPTAVVDEFNRLGALHSGGLPVQAPVFVDETEEHFGRPGLVIGYIDGEPDLNPDDPNKYVEQFAHLLAQIHHFDPKTSGLALAERPVRQFARFMKDDMPQANPVFQVDRIWAALASNCIRRDKEQAVLLHGDFWPGNTLWRNGSLLAVIDWEQPRRWGSTAGPSDQLPRALVGTRRPGDARFYRALSRPASY